MIGKPFTNKQFILSCLLCITCILGDKLVDIYKSSNVAKALLDNLTHGLIGYIVGCIVADEFKDRLSAYEQLLLSTFCFFIASVIDVDHFIEAKSFNLHVSLA